jgi:hypothetical protein
LASNKKRGLAFSFLIRFWFQEVRVLNGCVFLEYDMGSRKHADRVCSLSFFLSNYRYVCVHVLICIVIFVFVLISFIKIKYSKLVSWLHLHCFFL